MRAVLLAGGKGTRLKPFTVAFPKPLVPLGDVPVIEIVIQQLQEYGVTDLTIVTGHLAELIRSYLGNGSRFGVNIDYLTEETPLDTAGCLGYIDPPEEPFLVMNGDLLTTLSFTSMVDFHLQHRPMATVAAYAKKVTIDLGVLQIDDQDQLCDYREKPTHEFMVSMGIYCFEPGVCNFVLPGERISMPELILRLRDSGQQILCYREECYWLDIGRPDDYALATEEFCHDRSRFLAVKSAA